MHVLVRRDTTPVIVRLGLSGSLAVYRPFRSASRVLVALIGRKELQVQYIAVERILHGGDLSDVASFTAVLSTSNYATYLPGLSGYPRPWLWNGGG